MSWRNQLSNTEVLTMKTLEISKQIVIKTTRKSWDVATAPWRLSLHTINALADLLVENSDYDVKRKLIAEGLSELHAMFKESHRKVEHRMAGETEVYTMKINERYTVIFYFKKQLVGYKVSVEERLVAEYGKIESTLFGPLFLAEHLGTFRPYVHGDRISPTHELSEKQMLNLVELLQDVFNELGST